MPKNLLGILRSVLLCYIALAICASNYSFAAKPAIIKGTIKSQPSSSTYNFPHLVRAFKVVPPFESVSTFVRGSGSYKLPVPAGGYVVLVNTWKGDAKGYSTARKFVLTKAGKTLTLPKRLDVSRALAASGGPNGPTISVGNIRFINKNGAPLLRADGKPLTFDAVLTTELTAAPRSCNYYVVEDREFGQFGEVLKELKLQASKYVDAKYRKTLKSSLQKLALWAPQYRLTGSVTQIDDFNSSADLKIIELSSGKTVWCRHITFAAENLFGTFASNIAAAVSRTLCGADDLPASIQGGFSGEIHDQFLGTNVKWSAEATFLPTDSDPLHGQPSFAGVGVLTRYAASSIAITEWDLSGGNQCTLQAHDSASLINPLGGNMLVEVTPAECGERRYGFVTAVSAPNPTNVTMNCGGEITQYTQPWSITLNSDINYSSMSQFQGNSIKGNYSQGLVSWSWDMNAN